MPTLRKRAWFGLSLALALAALGIVSAQERTSTPPAQTIGLDQPVPVDPRITIGYLPNGLRYYIRANGRPYQRAELRLVVNIGSVVEDADQLGLAHFVEHMAFNGSRAFAKQDLIKFMESIGMRLGPGVNANTGFDETVYMLHVPTDNPEAMRKAFMFLGDVAHRSVVRPGRDREGARRHHRGMAAGTRARTRGCRTSRCPSCSRARATPSAYPIGTKESIEQFKPEALKRFYTDWYRPDLMAVIAVGDFNQARSRQLIKDEFGRDPGAGSAPAAARLRGAGPPGDAVRHRDGSRGADDDGRRLQHAAAARPVDGRRLPAAAGRAALHAA